jgi:hypothetical protein
VVPHCCICAATFYAAISSASAAQQQHPLSLCRLLWLFVLQLITGSVSQLEQLLPQVAYGNIMAEDPTALTAAHFRQLLLLGQACLDYLHAICSATSKVLVSPAVPMDRLKHSTLSLCKAALQQHVVARSA